MFSLLVLLAVQQTGPVMPVGVSEHLGDLNLSIQRSLQMGDFAVAETLFASWPTGKLTYSADQLPVEFARAGEAASALVAEASGGRVQFERGSSPRVKFTFAALPPEGPKEPVWKDGSVLAEVATTDRDGTPANPRSIVWGMAKAMAFAAGLDVTTRRRSLMGTVIYAKSVADPAHSQREQSILTQIEDVRLALAKAVKGRVRLAPAIPDVTVTPDTVELGTVTQGDRKEFSLTITNRGNAPALIEIETTCSCIIAQPSLVLAAGESVTQKPRFDSADYKGRLDKHLYVLSNSPENPRRTVLMRGMVVPEIRFLAPNGSRSVFGAAGDGLYEVEVPETGTSSLDLLFFGTNAAVELVDVQLGNQGASAEFVPFTGSVDDPLLGAGVRTGSKIVVALPESWPFGVSWLRVVGVTNSRRTPSVEMTLQIRRGIAASPQSMYFGDAKVGKQSERSAMIEHGAKSFEITKVEATGGVTASVEKVDGRRYKIIGRVLPAQAGPISGAITISTNSAVQPTVTIPVGGQAE